MGGEQIKITLLLKDSLKKNSLGLNGATASQNKHTTTEEKSKRKKREAAIVAAGITALGQVLTSIFGNKNKVTVTNTLIEQKMIPSTERASSGARPLTLNTENRLLPAELRTIAFNNVLNEYKVYVSVISESKFKELANMSF